MIAELPRRVTDFWTAVALARLLLRNVIDILVPRFFATDSTDNVVISDDTSVSLLGLTECPESIDPFRTVHVQNIPDASAKDSGSDCLLLLPKTDILLEELSLPVLNQKKMTDAISIQLELRYPFKASELSLSYKVLGLEPSTRTMRVLVVAVPTSLLQDKIAHYKARGKSISAVTSEAAPDLPLWVANSEVQARRRRWLGALLLVTLTVLMTATIAPLVIMSHRVDAEERVLASAIVRVRALTDQRDSVNGQLATHRTVQDASKNAPNYAAILDRVGDVGEFLTVGRLTLGNGQLQISGTAQNKTALESGTEKLRALGPLFHAAPAIEEPSGHIRFSYRLDVGVPQ